MPETCTCGTVTIEGAQFCHKCGRPLFEVEVAHEEPVVSIAPEKLPPLPSPLPVSFSNPIALRVGFMMSLGIMLIQMIPGVNLLFLVWWLGAGWGAVLVYRKLTGAVLSVRAGARLGTITGILTFLSMAVIFALTMVFMGSDVFDQLAKQDPQIKEVLGNPPNPSMMAGVVLMGLALIFAAVVGTCTAGGALGARFARTRNDL